jgi:hypothetical protein
MAVWDIAAGLEQIGVKEFVYKRERHRVVRCLDLIAVPAGEIEFAMVVLRAVVEAHGSDNFMVLPGPIKSRD